MGFFPDGASFDANTISLEMKFLLCSFSKLRTSGVELKEIMLALDLNDPIVTLLPIPMKLDPVEHDETSSQSTSQLISVSTTA